MSAPVLDSPAAASTPASGARRRRPPAWVVLTVAVVLALVVGAWVSRDGEKYAGLADPRNPKPDGAQALARVLADQGVEVTIARSAAELDDVDVRREATVVVTRPDQLTRSTLERLRRHVGPARVVLVEPSYGLVQQIDPDLSTLPVSPSTGHAVEADCAPLAGVDLDGLRLEVDDATAYNGTGCFTRELGPILRTVRDADGELVLFGAAQALTNDQVTRADNAAIALRLLGQDEQLVWYVPDPADAAPGDAVTLGSLLPDWLVPGLWMVLLAGIGLICWRFRRLGPLTTEPLPVVVRAVETTRSRGRMYRRSGDRAHAAHALRRAARTDLAGLLGLDRRAAPAAVVEAAARHLGTPVESVAALLDDHRPPPANDQELVRLAQDLALLRREVRRA
ncbi:DUF4350 domain-containing protein [Pimelobacter simplex]|uniref:DUF4350 domain-containing protein n=1 Tax=Nocardioides simplex TaxID=2045 RepID=UPI003AACF061